MKGITRVVKSSIGCLAIAIALLGIVDAGLWLTDHTELAIAVVAGGAILAAFALGNVWGSMLIERGANIALNAQVSDDQRDIQLLKTTGDMMKIWKQTQGELPALPMPGQQTDNWRCDYEEGDYEEVN